MAKPAVTITIAVSASRDAFEFRNRLGTSVTGGVGARLQEAVEKRDQLRRDLEAILKLTGGDLSLDFAQADRVFHRFAMLGIGLLLYIFSSVEDTKEDNASTKLEAIAKLFKEVMPDEPSMGNWPVVEIIAPPSDKLAIGFPFELLPFLNPVEPPAINDYGGLAKAMRAFLGFSAIVHRKRFGDPPHLQLKPAIGESPAKLPIKLFYHADLAGAVDEANFLLRRTDLWVDGPWPVEADIERGDRFVAHHIVNPATLLCGEERTPVDQIQHFSCHCDTQDKSSFFSLRAKDCEAAIDIRLDDLPVYKHLEQNRLAQESPSLECDMPLVVFNNCGGAAVNEAQLNAFVEFFWATNRNRGFISTQARIPDLLAGAFSKQFYINLLRKRLTVGEAVAEARRAVTLAYKNPISLFYVHYGSAFLRLAT